MIPFLCFYLTLIALISLYGLHRYWISFGAGRAVSIGDPQPLPAQHPQVLVQIPLFNEPDFEAVIQSAVELQWPASCLQIQVLDDSTDESSARVRCFVEELASAGTCIEWIHREDRTGYKAGALQAGLDRSTAEFVAIFDADFVIPPNFLQRSVPHFMDEKIAMVQGRWGFLNSEESWLTRNQALMLDGHFHVEHRARFGAGRFFNFNGTAGIWRVRAIEESGGWRAETVTEDLELSLEAWLRGWRFIYRDDLLAPSQLPQKIVAYKIQQNRWVAGSMHVARKFLPRIWRSDLGWRQKLDLSFYLTGNLNYPLLLLLVLCVPQAILLRLGGGGMWLWADLPFFAIATLSVGIFYTRASATSLGVVELWGVRVPMLMAQGLGMTIHNTRAVWRGLRGLARVFERTPKGELEKQSSRPPWRSRWPLFVEASMVAYLSSAVGFTVSVGNLISVPFLALFALGYLYVFTLSLVATHKS